jgi:hypothetical protein
VGEAICTTHIGLESTPVVSQTGGFIPSMCRDLMTPDRVEQTGTGAPSVAESIGIDVQSSEVLRRIRRFRHRPLTGDRLKLYYTGVIQAPQRPAKITMTTRRLSQGWWPLVNEFNRERLTS